MSWRLGPSTTHGRFRRPRGNRRSETGRRSGRPAARPGGSRHRLRTAGRSSVRLPHAMAAPEDHVRQHIRSVTGDSSDDGVGHAASPNVGQDVVDTDMSTPPAMARAVVARVASRRSSGGTPPRTRPRVDCAKCPGGRESPAHAARADAHDLEVVLGRLAEAEARSTIRFPRGTPASCARSRAARRSAGARPRSRRIGPPRGVHDDERDLPLPGEAGHGVVARHAQNR